MPQFIENILIGIRRWITKIIDKKSFVISSHINELYNTKEDKSNKVTSISDESTDIEYPSARCIYDEFEGTVDSELISSIGNISLSIGGDSEAMYGDHLFPHTETESDVPIRFIGFKGQEDDGDYEGDNYLKIGNDCALLSGKYTHDDESTNFNFNADGFDFRVCTDDEYTNYAVLNDDIHIGSESGDVSNPDDSIDYQNDIIKVKADGKVFIKGIGEFDGENDDTAQSLQEVIENVGLNEESAIVIAAALNDLNDRLLEIENSNNL